MTTNFQTNERESSSETRLKPSGTLKSLREILKGQNGKNVPKVSQKTKISGAVDKAKNITSLFAYIQSIGDYDGNKNIVKQFAETVLEMSRDKDVVLTAVAVPSEV